MGRKRLGLAIPAAMVLVCALAVPAFAGLGPVRANCGAAWLLHPSPGELHATGVAGIGFGCAELRNGAQTYLGAPSRCIRSTSCLQSGVWYHNGYSVVVCLRSGANVSCVMQIHHRLGALSFVLRGRGYGLSFP